MSIVEKSLLAAESRPEAPWCERRKQMVANCNVSSASRPGEPNRKRREQIVTKILELSQPIDRRGKAEKFKMARQKWLKKLQKQRLVKKKIKEGSSGFYR